MAITTKERNQIITSLLNGTFASIRNVVPLPFTRNNPSLLNRDLQLKFGVLIGITGDIKGKLVLTGELPVFASIGEAMFGMTVEGDMLFSFSGELGNMIAGGLSTNIIEQGIKTDITSPTVMEGDTRLTGFGNALYVPVSFEGAGDIGIYLLID